MYPFATSRTSTSTRVISPSLSRATPLMIDSSLTEYIWPLCGEVRLTKGREFWLSTCKSITTTSHSSISPLQKSESEAQIVKV